MTDTPVPGGLLIAVEGIDGAGKTTLVRSIVAALRMHELTVTASKEPTQGPWAEQLRQGSKHGRLPPAEELRLLLADRREHVDAVIKPALARDEIVILDRYFYSNAAYQGAAGLSVAEVLRANAFAPPADLLLVLDLSPAEALGRIAGRGDQANAFEREDTLAACRRAFQVLAAGHPRGRLIDATRPAADVLGRALAEFAVASTEKVQGLFDLKETMYRVARLFASCADKVAVPRAAGHSVP